jgi:hypothetical protein
LTGGPAVYLASQGQWDAATYFLVLAWFIVDLKKSHGSNPPR